MVNKSYEVNQTVDMCDPDSMYRRRGNVGEKPIVMLYRYSYTYTYTYRHVGTVHQRMKHAQKAGPIKIVIFSKVPAHIRYVSARRMIRSGVTVSTKELMYGQHFQQSMDQPGKVANPAHGQLAEQET